MFELAVEQTIAAGHQLREYQGKCERCHGHNWRVRLEIAVADLDRIGLGVDFGVLKGLLAEVLARYDHVMLNELPEFSSVNPTSEHFARTLFGECRKRVAALERPVTVKSVTVWESAGSSARYYE